MNGRPTISRVDYKDIYSLEKLLAAERLTTPDECVRVLDDALDFVVWGVWENKVILLTDYCRVLFTVQESDSNIVQVDCFPNYVDWDDDPCFQTFTLHKRYLKGIKMKIMANLDLECSFFQIVNGQQAELPDGD